MSSVDFQVVVIGAGPAGARCAARLAAAGRSVLLLDSASGLKPKLCGGLLNHRSQALLPAALPEHVRVAPAFMELDCLDADNRIRLRHAPGYLNIDRGAFDRWLIGLAREAGAQYRANCRVSGVELAADGAVVRLAGGQLRACSVVDATGHAMLTRRLSGRPLPWRLLCLQAAARLEPPLSRMWAVYHRAFSPLYGWAVPKGEACLLGGVLPHKLPHTAAGQPVDLLRVFDPLLEQLQRGGFSVSFLEKPRGLQLVRLRSTGEVWFGRDGLWVIGEAAGLVSPFSGEGISRALSSGEQAAAAILAGEQPEMLARRMGRDLAQLAFACRKATLAAAPLSRGLSLRFWQSTSHGGVQRLPWKI